MIKAEAKVRLKDSEGMGSYLLALGSKKTYFFYTLKKDRSSPKNRFLALSCAFIVLPHNAHHLVGGDFVDRDRISWNHKQSTMRLA
jgi:hypothetical protein